MQKTALRLCSAGLIAALVFGLFSAGVSPARAAGTVTLTALDTAYSEDFNTLASTGTANTAVPNGWDFSESGTNANTTYRAGTGSDNTGDTYSFGASGSSERAFGGLRSGTLVPLVGAQFTNQTGATITSLEISYTGEQWRLGQNTSGRAADRLDFQVSTNATSLTSGAWTDVDALDFASPVVAGTVGALNGNDAANRTALSGTISGLSLAPGATFWIRWVDSDLIPGADDGLSVDDFSLIPRGEVVADEAPAVTSTYPVDGAADFPLDANLTVTFSEPVTLASNWFSLDCSTSGAVAAAVTGGPTTFTLDPAVNLVGGESCLLTILASAVTDQDSNDPPDAMEVNFTVSFSTLDVCSLAYTPAYAIQGSGPTAAITGTVTTQGVVIGDYEGPSPALRGFFLQDLAGDGDPATSDGIFIFVSSNLNTVNLGEVVRVTGTAGENQGQTQVTLSSLVKCSTGAVEPVDLAFPVPAPDFLERYEGMLVRIPQTMYVTEHFQLGRFGQVVLSSGARLQQPTNVVTPGAPALALQAQNDLNKIILDDASQVQNPDPIIYGRGGLPLSASNTLRGGDTITGLVGVLNYTWAGNAASGNAYRIRPVSPAAGGYNFEAANPRPTQVPAVGGDVRVAGMNTLNFFNTFSGCTLGLGGAVTDCRGAGSLTEFNRQWPKTVAAILAIDPDVLGVNEVENDGYGPTSALAFLVDRLNDATAPGTYAYLDVDALSGQVNALGTDAIKVGLIYKPAVVTPVGQTAPLNSVAFVNGGDGAPRNRPALVQAFEQPGSGERFIVAVNHLKSKGSACDLPDAGDGQGNCNQVRVNAVNELLSFLAADPTGTGDPDVLIIGDLNSYALEDPITTLQSAGFTNLIASFLGPDAYSYVFDGQWGYLDHALGSPSIVSQVTGVGDFHINADEPSVLDYNTDFKSAGQIISLYAPDMYRVSDHDPVVIGLRLNLPPQVSAGGPYTVDEGGAVTLAASAFDPDGDTLTFEWDLDGNSSFETPGQSVTFSAAGLDGPSSVTVQVRVTDTHNHSAVDSAVITVQNVAPTLGPINAPLAPVLVNSSVAISANFTDPGIPDTHTALVDWGDGSSGPGTVVEAGGSGSAGGSHVYTVPGVYRITMTVTDKDGAVSNVSVFEYVVVYDPNGSFVTGSGWIQSPAGAYRPDSSLHGPANFGFVSRYNRGATIPSGVTKFQLLSADFNFRSTSYDWMVVNGSKIQLKGQGLVNGLPAPGGVNYKFIIYATIGSPDTFRIRIWYEQNGVEVTVYDNGAEQALAGGDITTSSAK